MATDLPLLPAKPGHFIAGEYRPSAGRAQFATFNPATDEELCALPLGDGRDIDLAVEAAEAALRGPWGRSNAGERAAILRRIADLIDRNRDALARLETLDTGKPLSETRTGDIARAAHNFRFFAELTAHQTNPTFIGDDGSWHTSLREPLGIVGLITPWNLPLYLATWKIAPALAQGNAVILKPAELTPLSAMVLGALCNEAGLPRGVFNIVQGEGAQSAGEALVVHPAVKAISFTGETLTGEAIMRAAAPTLKKLSFELGGKGASVVFADADLDTAAATATRAAFRNQGQICLAGSRLIVEESIAGPLLQRVQQHVAAIRVGDPLDEQTTMGSLIARSHREKVSGFVEAARQDKSLTIATGGRIPAGLERGAFYAPTVITGVAQESRLIQEEIFGPVLTVQTFRTFDEAMGLLNGTRYGLSCSIWTKDLARAQAAARAAKTGLVWINSWFVRDLHAAFGGMKRSGVGREGGQLSLDFFSDMKTVTMPAPGGYV